MRVCVPFKTRDVKTGATVQNNTDVKSVPGHLITEMKTLHEKKSRSALSNCNHLNFLGRDKYKIWFYSIMQVKKQNKTKTKKSSPWEII